VRDRPAPADKHEVPPPHQRSDERVDAFCRVVRCIVGSGQLQALTRLNASHPHAERVAMEQAVMSSAWSRAMPGEHAAEWVRAVQPLDPGIEDVEADMQLVVLVAGLRRDLVEAASRGDDGAEERLAAARETFGEPGRDEILRLIQDVFAEQ
jgi:hypothetical protein